MNELERLPDALEPETGAHASPAGHHWRASMDRLTAQETALKSLTRAVLECDDVEAALARITEAAANTLGARRASVWRFRECEAAIECIDLFDTTSAGHSAGLVLRESDFPAYFRALRDIEVIAADQAWTDPRTSEFRDAYLVPLGISSMLDAPIRLYGAPAGVVCHEHVGPPRRWTPDERTFAVAVANLVSLALENAERRRSERALRASQLRFRQLAEHIREVFWLLDPHDQRLVYVSPAFRAVWGSEPDPDLATEVWRAAVHPDDQPRVSEHDARLVTIGEASECEYRIIREDGTIRRVRERAYPVRRSDGGVTRVAGIAEDVTDRSVIETQLKLSQSMEAYGQLAVGVAHELGSLLTIVQRQSTFLLDQHNLDESVRRAVGEIADAAARASGLTHDLLHRHGPSPQGH